MVRHRRDTHISKSSSNHEPPPSQVDPSIRRRRKYNRQKPREVTWTKPPKFTGQATFDLNRNMMSVPSSRQQANTDSNLDISSRSQVSTEAHTIDARSDGKDDSNPAGACRASEMEAYEDTIAIREVFRFRFQYLPDRILYRPRAIRWWPESPKYEIATPEGCERRLAEILDRSRIVDMNYDYSGFSDDYPRSRDLFSSLSEIRDCLVACMALSLDCRDPRTYRIASLKLGLYASAARLVEKAKKFMSLSVDRYLLLDEWGMPASMWKECVFDFMEALKHRQTDSINLDDVKEYLLSAKDVIRSLQMDAPRLTEYWNSYLEGLDHYIDCLEQIREGRTDWNHPDVYLGDYGQQPHKRPDYLPSGMPSTPSITMGMLHHWTHDGTSYNSAHQHRHNGPDPFIMALSDRPVIAAVALRGWTVFGQAIADTFDYYHRMYKILSFTSLPQVYRGLTHVIKSFLWTD